MKMMSLVKELSSNTYPGRGIVIGQIRDGKYVVTAYFIMEEAKQPQQGLW